MIKCKMKNKQIKTKFKMNKWISSWLSRSKTNRNKVKLHTRYTKSTKGSCHQSTSTTATSSPLKRAPFSWRTTSASNRRTWATSRRSKDTNCRSTQSSNRQSSMGQTTNSDWTRTCQRWKLRIKCKNQSINEFRIRRWEKSKKKTNIRKIESSWGRCMKGYVKTSWNS